MAASEGGAGNEARERGGREVTWRSGDEEGGERGFEEKHWVGGEISREELQSPRHLRFHGVFFSLFLFHSLISLIQNRP